MSFAPFRIAAVLCCAAALLAGPIRCVSAAEQNAAATQSPYQSAIAPTARLQVSGAGESITLDVERADVQTTLKSVLKQAGKQFAPDATVTGQVTLLLTNQPLETVLRAICDSCYLRYTKTSAGIYRFSRDDEAVRKAFTNLKQLNTALRAQLRALGLDVPPEDRFGVQLRGEPAGGAAGFGGGAAARRDSERDYGNAQRKAEGAPSGPASGNTVPEASGAPKSAGAAGALKKDAQNRIANIHTDFLAQADTNQILSSGARTGVQNQQSFGMMLRQNGFVWFNIPEEKPEPVATVLQLFSQQSNTPILLDQSIPNSLKFRVWGSLSPRQLPEALNVLAPTAHLQWRWIGNSVFVVPAPNFQVYFGEQGTLRNAYPAPQRGDTGQADGKGRGGQQ